LSLGSKHIPATLAELVQPGRAALLLEDMEYAIAPIAFNYTSILSNLQRLSALAREVGVPVFYSVQTGLDPLKEEAPRVGSRNRELHELALKLMEQTHFDIATANEIAAIWQGK
jgi:nicotinamidase-related amidase